MSQGILHAVAKRARRIDRAARKPPAAGRFVYQLKEGLLGYNFPAVQAPLADIDEKRCSIRFQMSSPVQDADGDVVQPLGIDLARYRNNPVWFWNHQEHPFSLGTSLDPDTGILLCELTPEWYRATWLADQKDPFAMFLFDKYARHILNATSIGFIPKPGGAKRIKGGSGEVPGWMFTAVTLLENTICGVGSNPEALRLSLDRENPSEVIRKCMEPFAAKCRGLVNGWAKEQSRGQPDNAGQFGPGGGSAKPDKEKPSASGEADATKTAAEDYAKNGTKAKAFKEWFGDWESDPAGASKVVNSKGVPQETHGEAIQKVYHGTLEDFNAFGKETIGKVGVHAGKGFYFAENKEIAHQYSLDRTFQPRGGEKKQGRIIEAYLNIRKPFDFDSPAAEGAIDKWADAAEAVAKDQFNRADFVKECKTRSKKRPLTNYDLWRGVAAHTADGPNRVNDVVRSLGHDGLVHTAGDLSRGEILPPEQQEKFKGYGRVWVTFESIQVKAASNAGTFDQGDPNINKSADAALILKLTDASGHEHADDGKFGSGGSASKMPGSSDLHTKAEASAKGWAAKAASIPGAVLSKAKGMAVAKFKAWESTYGRPVAYAAIGAFFVGSVASGPIPGGGLLGSALVINAAKLYMAARGTTEAKALENSNGKEWSDEELTALGEKLMAELLAEAEDEPEEEAKSMEAALIGRLVEKVKDDSGHEHASDSGQFTSGGGGSGGGDKTKPGKPKKPPKEKPGKGPKGPDPAVAARVAGMDHKELRNGISDALSMASPLHDDIATTHLLYHFLQRDTIPGMSTDDFKGLLNHLSNTPGKGGKDLVEMIQLNEIRELSPKDLEATPIIGDRAMGFVRVDYDNYDAIVNATKDYFAGKKPPEKKALGNLSDAAGGTLVGEKSAGTDIQCVYVSQEAFPTLEEATIAVEGLSPLGLDTNGAYTSDNKYVFIQFPEGELLDAHEEELAPGITARIGQRRIETLPGDAMKATDKCACPKCKTTPVHKDCEDCIRVKVPLLKAEGYSTEEAQAAAKALCLGGKAMDMGDTDSGSDANGGDDTAEKPGLKMCKALHKALEEHEPMLDNPRMKALHKSVHKSVYKAAEAEYPGEHGIPEPKEKAEDETDQEDEGSEEEKQLVLTAARNLNDTLATIAGPPRRGK